MASASLHTWLNIAGVAVFLLIAVRYSSEMGDLMGSAASSYNSVFATTAGFPGGNAIPAAPLRSAA
jgi:hypothetical protein